MTWTKCATATPRSSGCDFTTTIVISFHKASPRPCISVLDACPEAFSLEFSHQRVLFMIRLSCLILSNHVPAVLLCVVTSVVSAQRGARSVTLTAEIIINGSHLLLKEMLARCARFTRNVSNAKRRTPLAGRILNTAIAVHSNKVRDGTYKKLFRRSWPTLQKIRAPRYFTVNFPAGAFAFHSEILKFHATTDVSAVFFLLKGKKLLLAKLLCCFWRTTNQVEQLPMAFREPVSRTTGLPNISLIALSLFFQATVTCSTQRDNL